jgi:UDP-glucose 4-epimerase
MSSGQRTIWITGAAGFIGSTLASVVTGNGERCFGIDLRAGQSVIPAGNLVEGPVSEAGLASLLQRSGAPDIIFHLAGGSAVGPSFADPAADFHATVASTASLLGFLRRHAPAAVTVLASSAAVYGSDHDGPVAEDAALHPMSPYGMHKLMMEDLARYHARFFGLDVRIARLFSVYGAGLRKQLLWDLCEKLSRAERVVLGGTGDELRDFIHGADAAKALDALSRFARTDSPLLVNIASGHARSVGSIADAIARCWSDRTGRRGKIAFDGASRPGDPASLIADTAAMRTLGIAAETSFDAGVAAYVDWYLADRRLTR